MHLTRKKKLLLNTSFSMINQIVSFVSGFILPRLFLRYYGSAVNGLVASITQFLSFISLAEMGVGAVIQSALYKPLAENDEEQISKIVISSERFFRRIALILLVYSGVMMIVYPLRVKEQFDFLFTVGMIAVIVINTFSQYYFGMTYRLLLNADQMGFIQLGSNTVLLIVNAIMCIVLMSKGASIILVKMVTSLLFMIQPLVFSIVVRKRYCINRHLVLTGEPIKQKWNGLAQHVANVVLQDTDTVVLTFFSTLENVSVYAVYHLVVNGIKKIINSMTAGMQALLGNMLAKNETEALRNTFDYFEWFMHTIATLSFGIAGYTILPFVMVYTRDITDVNYIVPSFAVLITAAQASYSIRTPYNMLTLAAGHYRQTQVSAIVEALINIIISIALVYKYGLIGVAIGTLTAMVYRTVYLAIYISRNILQRSINLFIKHIVVDFAIIVCMWLPKLVFKDFFTLSHLSYGAWVVLAFKEGIVGLGVSLIINFIAYRDQVMLLKGKLKRKVL